MKRCLLSVLTVASFFIISCKEKTPVQAELTPVMEKALYDSTSAFYGNFGSYPEDLSHLPIGVFDSGTGGLTVLEKFLSLDKYDNITGKRGEDKILDFAGEHFIYLADQANMPYGNYDAEGKSDYLRELAVKDALFLLGDKYYINTFESAPSGIKEKVKIIVIACNTATAYGLGDISKMLELSNTGVKVIGVINAGVKATLDRFQSDSISEPCTIGVLATPGTITSGAYEKTIKDSVAARNIPFQIGIISQKGYGFAEAVDREDDYVSSKYTAPRPGYRGPRIGNGDDSLNINLMDVYNFDFSGHNMLYTKKANGGYSELQLNSSDNYARFNLVSLIEKYRAGGSKSPIKAIILGCTHYPFALQTLEKVIEEMRNYKKDGNYVYRSLLAKDLVFIDPALYTAIECYNTLRTDNNLALRITGQELQSYISVPNITLADTCLTSDGKLTYEFKYGRNVGTEDITTKQVPFSRTNIDENNLARIDSLLPYSFSMIYPTLN